MSLKKIGVIICVLLAVCFYTQAKQLILFQLPTSGSQIKYAQEKGDAKTVEILKQQDFQIATAIIKSFREQLTEADVYFFFDNDHERVKQGDLTGLLFLNVHGDTIAYNATDFTNYYIANYGFFPRELEKGVVDGEEVYIESPENHFGKGIILNDPSFQPFRNKLRFTPCKVTKRGSIFKPKSRYYVFSGVAHLNRKLEKFNR